jgi:hypothetical protein
VAFPQEAAYSELPTLRKRSADETAL